MTRVVVVLAALALGSVMAASQLTPGTAVDRRTVWVHATVLDAEGRLVTGLTRDRFEVRDEGVLQDISVFSNQLVPFSAALMLDSSGSMQSDRDLVTAAAEAFVGRFIRGDRVVVGNFSVGVWVGQRFSANRGRVLEAVSLGVRGMGMPCLPPSEMEARTSMPRGPIGTRFFDAVECAVMALNGDDEAIRRVVVMVTDGKDYGSFATDHTAIRLATRSGVMVYVVGIYGDEGMARRMLGDLSSETGGGFFILKTKKQMPETFARLADELHRQYILGFVPNNAASGNRRIAVSVTGPGLAVRARRNYNIVPAK
jgi:Ca-activated chloride channel homolog